MKRIPIIITILFSSLLLISCNFDSRELIELRNEVRFLETENSSLRGSPGYTFGQAFDFVDAEDYNEAVDLLNDLKFNFPEWNAEIVDMYIEKYSEMRSDTTNFQE